jgi:hypothetical protein
MSTDQFKKIISTNKQKYREFCTSQHNLPIFYYPEWLDITTSGGEWDVVLTMDNAQNITACLPYFVTIKYGQRAIIMPPLTPYGGVFIIQNNATKKESYIKNEKALIAELIGGLPKRIVYFSQSFYYNFSNWLPFYWKKYQQTTRYSFVIEGLDKWSMADVATNIRNKIRKADQDLTIKELHDPKIVYQQLYDVLEHKNIHLALSEETFIKLDTWLKTKDKRLILGAVDHSGQVFASIYLIFDQGIAYSLMIGSDINQRQNGSVPFLIYHAILAAQQRCNTFDFEGSMLESLFDLFAGFGGELKPYHRIYKAKNIFWDIAYRIKSYYDKSNR